MLDQKGFQESDSKEVLLSEITPGAMRVLLNYIYTGDSSFVRDDLMTGISVLQVASRFMLDRLRDYCEFALSTRLSEDTVVGLYNAAFHSDAASLLSACQHYFLNNYADVSKKNPQAKELLLHLLDQAKVKKVEVVGKK